MLITLTVIRVYNTAIAHQEKKPGFGDNFAFMLIFIKKPRFLPFLLPKPQKMQRRPENRCKNPPPNAP